MSENGPSVKPQGVAGLSDLSVPALLCEFGQGPLFQVRGERLAQGPVSEFVRLAHPADVKGTLRAGIRATFARCSRKSVIPVVVEYGDCYVITLMTT